MLFYSQISTIKTKSIKFKLKANLSLFFFCLFTKCKGSNNALKKIIFKNYLNHKKKSFILNGNSKMNKSFLNLFQSSIVTSNKLTITTTTQFLQTTILYDLSIILDHFKY